MATVGCAPNAAARTPRSGRSAMIGVVMHHVGHTGEANVIERVTATAHGLG